MPEPQTPATPQAGGTGDTSPQAGTTTPSEPQAGDETISLDEARKLRKENQTLRQRQKTIDDAKLAEEAANLSELQKTAKERDAFKQRLDAQQKQLVAAEVKIAAQAKGIIDPELASLAILDKLEYGDDGMPTNLDKALDDLVKNKPYLKPADPGPAPSPARSAPPTGANNPGRSNTNAPGTLVPGQTVSLSDMFRKK